jgi:hypothetical protein
MDYGCSANDPGLGRLGTVYLVGVVGVVAAIMVVLVAGCSASNSHNGDMVTETCDGRGGVVRIDSIRDNGSHTFVICGDGTAHEVQP